MNKLTIVCDLDDTLIDTQRLKQDLFGIARSLGVQDPEKIYKETLANHTFHVPLFAHALLGNGAKADEYMRVVGELLQQPQKYNYPGAEEFCATLAKDRTLILLTYGHPEFQMVKLQQSGLEPYFTEVIVTQERSKEQELKRVRDRHGALLVLDNSDCVIATAQKLALSYHQLTSVHLSAVYAEQLLRVK